MKLNFFRSLVAFSLALFAVFAQAGTIMYATGAGNPWDSTTNDAAMDAAFGAGAWTKQNGFDTSIFNGAQFVYLDGGDTSFSAFSDFVSSSHDLITGYVAAGGRLFLNAAPQGYNGHNLDLGFGVTLSFPGLTSVAYVTDAGVNAGLTAGGLPTNYFGSMFANATLSSTDLTALIASSGAGLGSGISHAGDTIVGAMQYGKGFVAFGTQTPVEFHSGSGAQLLENQLHYFATAAVNDQPPADVPEPASLALLGAGMFGLGFVRRKRRG